MGHRALSVFYISIFGRPRSITRYHFPRKFLSFHTVASTLNDSCSDIILIGTRIYRYSIQRTILSILADKFIAPKQITGLLRHEAVNELSISITARIAYVYREWSALMAHLPGTRGSLDFLVFRGAIFWKIAFHAAMLRATSLIRVSGFGNEASVLTIPFEFLRSLE